MTNTVTVSDNLAMTLIICGVVLAILVGIVAVLMHTGVIKWKKWRKKDNLIPSVLVRYCSDLIDWNDWHVNAPTVIVSFVTPQ